MRSLHEIRRRTWEVLEVGAPGDQLSRALDVIVLSLIFGNVFAVVLESVPAIEYHFHELFLAFERVSIAAFSAEFAARVWSAAGATSESGSDLQKRLRYLGSPLAIADVLAIAPFYLAAFVNMDLRFMRVLRLVRLVKLTRYSGALNHVFEVYRLQRSALAASYFLMGIAIVLAASLVYVVEQPAQPEDFASIPVAMWWAVCTLTTVGYGDVTPITTTGKVFASLIQLVGIAMVALPTSLFASGFAHIMNRNEQTLEDEAREALADGIISGAEADAYEALADRLYVEPEIARDIIRAAQREHALGEREACPHCGKALD